MRNLNVLVNNEMLRSIVSNFDDELTVKFYEESIDYSDVVKEIDRIILENLPDFINGSDEIKDKDLEKYWSKDFEQIDFSETFTETEDLTFFVDVNKVLEDLILKYGMLVN